MGSRDSKVRVHPSLPDTGLSVLSNSTEKEDFETGPVAPGGVASEMSPEWEIWMWRVSHQARASPCPHKVTSVSSPHWMWL